MKWVLIIAGALVALVLLVMLVGSLLPVGHVASRSARLRQPPEAVWSAITDVAAYPTWRADVKSVELVPATEGHPRWIENMGGERIAFEATASDPPRHLVVRIADPELPFGGSWTYDLSPTAEGTQLRITENGEVYNPIFRFVSRFVFGHTATIDAFVRSLGRRFGEQLIPEAG